MDVNYNLKSKDYMIMLAKQMTERAHRMDEPGKVKISMAEQIGTLEMNKQNKGRVALPPRALLYGMRSHDLVDIAELFCRWLEITEYRMFSGENINDVVERSESIYGSYESFEKVFVNTASKFIHEKH